ncbi:phage tail protein [Haematospirillum jordaniae]|uniref:phage tail sheath subtilisin-like domain-containing protein n=1 Tax=Haematospirillum jordaniae TaxID=1549855 RepID=UPI00143330DF|nr:phage tail sheath subtilisin-like domain-containing protein [Haematospirillum jordaniae]NKD58048.1 phage tail protein [Haematospirillum jordaniae]NKD80138.1 phage tail protein [Haematospirillum jordaniae]
MSVSFNTLPVNVRVPLFYAEVDNSQASYFERQNRTLLIGQMISGGTARAGVPQQVSRTDQARVLFGAGSMLARMHAVYRAGDTFGEVWCIALDDAAASVAATGTVRITGTASAAGIITLYIAGQRVQGAVAVGDTAAAVARMLAGVITRSSDLPVTAAADGGKITLTCRWKGETGNDITLIPNYRGALGGESDVPGLSVTVVPMAGGAGNPDIAVATAAMGDEEYDHVVCPYSDAATLDALAAEMGDTTGRWSWSRQIYGHVWAARRGSAEALATFGRTRNDQHCTIAGFEADLPSPAWEYAAAWAARSSVFLNNEPERPTQTGELCGILPPQAGKRFTLTEKQSLLYAGIATSMVSGGAVRIERSVTTYQKNAWGQPDPSYLDAETLFLLAYVLRYLRQRITQKYPRHALANDGTRFGTGKAMVTPGILRAELIAAYRELERDGKVENAEAFKAALIVERDSTNPNRVNVLYPPDLVNQLRIFAVLAQFRLQYPDAA